LSWLFVHSSPFPIHQSSFPNHSHVRVPYILRPCPAPATYKSDSVRHNPRPFLPLRIRQRNRAKTAPLPTTLPSGKRLTQAARLDQNPRDTPAETRTSVSSAQTPLSSPSKTRLSRTTTGCPRSSPTPSARPLPRATPIHVAPVRGTFPLAVLSRVAPPRTLHGGKHPHDGDVFIAARPRPVPSTPLKDRGQMQCLSSKNENNPLRDSNSPSSIAFAPASRS
jgi:hypothetical protein